MHEMGVVLNIVDTAERLASRYQVSRFGYITVELGELSGVHPRYLTDLWPLGTKDTICEGAELVIEEEKSIVRCSRCGAQYPIMENLEDNFAVCPECGHDHYTVLTGGEIIIKEIGIPEDE